MTHPRVRATSRGLARRTFLGGLAGAGAGLWLGGCRTVPAAGTVNLVQGRKLRHAGIGVGGMGFADLGQIGAHPDVEIVALADVDAAMLEPALARFPEARTFRDWRVLLAELGDELDSVHVSTPDHMHAPIALEALARGLHVYAQKPLTRTVSEARAVARAARASGVVTQMGIQNHSNAQYAAAHELFRRNLIGPIHEVHVWSDRPAGWWPQGVEREPGSDDVPETLDWDLWLGTAPQRPFKAGQYHPFAWRGRLDFGTGAQGDMACHLMDPAVWFLGLGAPLTLRSDGPAPNGESYPLWSRVHYTFAANDLTTRGPLHLTWHDGGKLPPVDLLERLGTDRDTLPKNGCLFVGTEGALLANPYGEQQLFPTERFADVAMPALEGVDHWHQWVDACRGVGRCSAPFGYSAALTEIALLGNVALHFPHETLRWNARAMRFPERPAADVHLEAAPRDGWSSSRSS